MTIRPERDFEHVTCVEIVVYNKNSHPAKSL
jgi:hypothetical protein